MGQRITLYGNDIVIEEVFHSRTIPIDEGLHLLTEQAPFKTSRLPRDTVLLGLNGDGHARVVIEKPPRRVHLRLITPYDDNEYWREEDHDAGIWTGGPGSITAIEVPVPWEYYAFEISMRPPADKADVIDGIWCQGAYLFWSHQRVTGWDSHVTPANVHNVFTEGPICLGDIDITTTDPAAYMQDLSETFYDHVSNWDTGYRAGPTKTLADWTSNDRWNNPANWRVPLREGVGSLEDYLSQRDALNVLQGVMYQSSMYGTDAAKDWVRTNVDRYTQQYLARVLTEVVKS